MLSYSLHLVLFVRLTAVILQEQKFADEFLVTPRARQCIGQACRTALISPLIQSMAARSDCELKVLQLHHVSLPACSHFSPAQDGLSLTSLVQDYVNQMSPPVAIQWKALATAASLAPIQVGTIASHDFDREQQRLVQVCFLSQPPPPPHTPMVIVMLSCTYLCADVSNP